MGKGEIMTINVLLFEYKEYEKEFFKKHIPDGFNITFFEESLNKDNVNDIPKDIRDKTTAIMVCTNSQIDKEVINSFKNLRIVTTRSNSYTHICHKAADERNIAIFNIDFCNDEKPEENSDKILQTSIDQMRDMIKGKNIYGSV